MKRKLITAWAVIALFCMVLSGCGGSKEPVATEPAGSEVQSEAVTEMVTEAAETTAVIDLEPGIYTVDFVTDSSMFHVNETCEGKGTLTVDDTMTLHITLVSKNIVNLYLGLAEDAKKDGAEILQPITDTVTYSDGMTEEVYGFDVPVTVIGSEFDLALLGAKGKWYDHKVSISNPEPVE